MTSMIIDSALISFFSLHAVAEIHIANRERKKSKRDCNPKYVFHVVLLELRLLTRVTAGRLTRFELRLHQNRQIHPVLTQPFSLDTKGHKVQVKGS